MGRVGIPRISNPKRLTYHISLYFTYGYKAVSSTILRRTMSGASVRRREQRSRTAVIARVTIATLVATAGVVMAPVVSTGSSKQPIEPTITEDSVSPEDANVVADFDVAGVVLSEESTADSVEVRVRDDNGWGEWTTLEVVEADAGPDRGTVEYAGARKVTEPVLAAASSEIEVRVPDGEQAEVVLIDGGSPGSSTTQSAGAAPAIVSRADWGADESLVNCSASTLSAYKAAVVHHTVNANTYTATQAPALVRSIYAYHTNALGWCDVGYQFLVDRFGTIYEGRAGALTRAVMGAQSSGFNSDTFGVSIIGDFSTERPSAASVTAVDSVIQWQLGKYGINPASNVTLTSAGNSKYPAGRVVTLPAVMGHRDNGLTACPGDGLYALLPTFRKPLATSTPTPAPTPTPSPTPTPKPTPTPAPKPSTVTREVTASVLNVRASASSTGKVVGQLKKGAKITGTYSGSWFKITAGTFNGRYVHGDYLRVPPAAKPAPAPKPAPKPSTVTREVTASVLNVRSSASSTGKVVGQLKKGAKITGTYSGSWFKISAGTFKGRFVHGDYLKAVKTTTPAPKPAPTAKQYVVTASTLNVRAAGSTSAKVIGTVRSGTVLTGTISGSWLKITAGTHKGGFVHKDYVKAR